MMRHFWICLVFFPLLVSGQKSVNTNTANWNTAGHWTPSGVPTASDDVTWNRNPSPTLTINAANAFAASVTVEKAGTLTINGFKLTVSGDFTAKNDLIINLINGGELEVGSSFIAKNNLTFNVCGTCDVTVFNFTAENNANIDINGEMTIENNLSIGGGTTSLDVNDGGILRVEGDITSGGDRISTNGSGVVYSSDCSPVDDLENCVDGALPITLGSFYGEIKGTSVVLSWKTLSELNFEYFDVQKANASGKFESIGRVNGHGNTSDPRDYQWNDERPFTGINYYRLISNDFDGYTEVFDPIMVMYQPGQIQGRQVFPNPASPGSELHLTYGSEGEKTIRWYRLSGELLAETTSADQTLTIPASLQSGVYLVVIVENGLETMNRIVLR